MKNVARKESGWKFKSKSTMQVPKVIRKLYEKHGKAYRGGLAITLTREDARMILDYAHPNRDLKNSRINLYRSRMDDGTWIRESGYNLLFDNDMRQMDGQSRLNSFLESKLEQISIDVAINVSKKMVDYFADDRECVRTPTDRAQRIARGSESPRNLVDKEMQILGYAYVYSALNEYGLAKVSAQMFSKINDNKNLRRWIEKMRELRDGVNTPSKSEKSDAAFWACVLRALPSFEKDGRMEDLERLTRLVFNSMQDKETKYDGWGKVISDFIRRKDKTASNSGWKRVRGRYDLLNRYIYNFYAKIECPMEVRIRYLDVKNRMEYFPNSEDAKIYSGNKIKKIEIEVEQDKKLVEVEKAMDRV